MSRLYLKSPHSPKKWFHLSDYTQSIPRCQVRIRHILKPSSAHKASHTSIMICFMLYGKGDSGIIVIVTTQDGFSNVKINLQSCINIHKRMPPPLKWMLYKEKLVHDIHCSNTSIEHQIFLSIHNNLSALGPTLLLIPSVRRECLTSSSSLFFSDVCAWNLTI